MTEAPARGTVQSVERSFEVLEVMARAGEDLGVTDISERAGLPQPTVHRLLKTLCTLGYVYQTPRRRYALGTKLIPLSEGAGGALGRTLMPALRPVVAELNESVNVAMLDHTAARYVAHLASERSMRMFTEVGRTAALHATAVGKAMLATMADAQVRAVVATTGLPPVTPRTITSVEALLREVAATRDRGYSLDDEEQELGVNCVAVAVPGPLRLAVSVSGPMSRMTPATVDAAVPVLRRAALRISELVSPA